VEILRIFPKSILAKWTPYFTPVPEIKTTTGSMFVHVLGFPSIIFEFGYEERYALSETVTVHI
jgi:hypothetical protein